MIRAAAALAVLVGPFCTSARADEQEVALVSFAANIHSFPFSRVKYKLTSANAASEEAALAGRWEDSTTATAILIVDGVYEKFELDAGPPPKPPALKKGQTGAQYVSSRFASTQYLAGTPGAAGLTLGLGAINLFPTESGDSGFVDTTPLNMGEMGHRITHGPHRLAADSLTYETTFRGKKSVSGRDAIGISFKKRQTGEVFDFWLDPARGHLPLRIDTKTVSNRLCKTHLMSARLCSKDRWFPERVLSTYPKVPGQPAVKVDEMLVLELDVDNKPRPEDFSMKAPAGTQVIFQDKKGLMILKQDETILARDLPKLYDMTKRALTTPLSDTGLTHRAARRSWWWLYVALGVVLLAFGTVRYRRSRAERSTAG